MNQMKPFVLRFEIQLPVGADINKKCQVTRQWGMVRTVVTCRSSDTLMPEIRELTDI